MSMKMGRRIGLIGCVILVVGLVLVKGATATTYEVGDSLGWNVPHNTTYYSTWASSKTFFLGDKFSFNWTSGTHDVGIVSKADYDNCTKVVSVIGSPFIYTPQSTGPYYFICTVNNHCEQGQKFAITIDQTPNFTVGSPSSAPESPNSSASSLTVGAFFAVLSIALVSFFTY